PRFGESQFEERPAAPLEAPNEIEGLGGTVSNSEAKIEWSKGIKDQGGPFEDYVEKENPDAVGLPPTSKAFDAFNPVTGEAISAKTLNTLSVTYIKNPQSIYGKVAGYVDQAADYQPRARYDVDPTQIESKTIHLAIPEYTSSTQWRYLNQAIEYGKQRGVSIVITRIRE